MKYVCLLFSVLLFSCEIEQLNPSSKIDLNEEFSNQQTSELLTIDSKVLTNAATSITTNSAVLSVKYKSEISDVTEKGICYGKLTGPTTLDIIYKGDKSKSSISTTALNLISGTTYYVRGYYKTKKGTFYGNEISFKTLIDLGANLKNGLVAYFPFSGSPNDIGPNKSVGTVYGAELQTDRFNTANSAYYFSSVGSTPRIETTLNTTSITSGLTISIWVLKMGDGTSAPRILDFASSPIDNPGHVQVGFGFQNLWGVIHNNTPTSYFVTNSPVFPIGPLQWTHIVYTIDVTTAKFYQDGILLGSYPTVGGSPILAPFLTIGRMNHPAYDAFNGKLDDIGVWNRVLSLEEVKYLFQNDFKP
jgi:hypothetical protein